MRTWKATAPGGIPLFEGTKADAIKAAKQYMATHLPENEYGTVQVSPYVNGSRDWKTYSVRWVPKGMGNVNGKPGWRQGEGIR